MKFFSQGVDLDDMIVQEEPRFFLGPEPDSLELVSSHSQPNLASQASVRRSDDWARSNPTLQHSKTVQSMAQYTASVLKNPVNRVLPSGKNGTKLSSSATRPRTTETARVPCSNTDSSVKGDRTEQLTVTPSVNGGSKKLTSKCSVIMYDDDLRRHSGRSPLSVSNNVSPKRTPVPQDSRPLGVNDDHAVVIQVDRAEEVQADAFPARADNDTSSCNSEVGNAKQSDPSPLLSVTDTDSAVSSAASRLSSPCCDVLNTSSPATTVTQTWTVHKAKDSAYQTKESSVDVFETGRESRRRKSLPTARVEDRRVTQRLHQAAVKLLILQQRVRKARLSRDSAVNTISEDEDEDDGPQSRSAILSRLQLTSLDSRDGGTWEEEEEEEYREDWEKHRIEEEEEEEEEQTEGENPKRDLYRKRGLNTTPEILSVTAENIVEESLDYGECEA